VECQNFGANLAAASLPLGKPSASGKTLCLWENPLPLSILSEHERQ